MKGLTIGLSAAWQIAAEEASSAGYQYIEKEHILIGICRLQRIVDLAQGKTGVDPATLRGVQTENDDVSAVLSECKLDPALFRRQIRKRMGVKSYKSIEAVIHRSEECKRIFAKAIVLSEKADEVSSLHFVAALMDGPGVIVDSILQENAINPADLARYALAKAAQRETMSDYIFSNEENLEKAGTPYLDKFGRDLTAEAREGKLGPFIGRRSELLQVIQTLARKIKCNPVLVGEAGVGKTAIVEALAIRVVNGEDPQVLDGKRIVELNMGNLVAGCRLRGDFEKRLSQVIKEANQHREVIVFIDEIHTVVGAGRSEGGLEAANILKPALGRGDLRCIGATTLGEYRRYIEQDPALERRFEKIFVSEPSPAEAIEMLTILKPKLETHHHVQIEDSALHAAVNLSIRFDSDHQLPDKAIDLLDKASARIQIPSLSMGQNETDKLKTETTTRSKLKVTSFAIAQVLSERIGVPLMVVMGNLENNSASRLLSLENLLNEQIIGQEEAIAQICQRLLVAHSGLESRRRPLGIFMFIGPTGVGKTETAKILAGSLFGSKTNLIRLDMSEFMEEHSVAKLIGSPPGYVGYEAEGQLTGKIRTNPYSVILLDEIEKAHPRVLDIFLQLFDDGRLTDSKGRTVDAKNAIFIMTSNLKMDSVREPPPFYDGPKKAEDTREKLRHFMRPEFLNRIDEIVVFKHLRQGDVVKILQPVLNKLITNIKSQYGVTLEITGNALRFLAEIGYSMDYGVRELNRTVERLIEVPLSHIVLSDDLKKNRKWRISVVQDQISISPVTNDRKDLYETEKP